MTYKMRARKQTKISPAGAYKALYGKFGPQGWWPVTRPAGKGPAYHRLEYSGKSPGEKFEICAGALLTQNTSWKNVERALVNLERAGALSVEKTASMGRARLASLIRPSGYYNQKAGRLKGFALYVAKHYGGDIARLLDKPAGALREELLAIKGIGPETADSMILYAAEKPSFVVDAYTLRLGRRLGWFAQDVKYDTARRTLSSGIFKSLKVYNEFHALVVAHSKQYCRKKPVCAGCPVRSKCRYEREP